MLDNSAGGPPAVWDLSARQEGGDIRLEDLKAERPSLNRTSFGAETT